MIQGKPRPARRQAGTATDRHGDTFGDTGGHQTPTAASWLHGIIESRFIAEGPDRVKGPFAPSHRVGFASDNFPELTPLQMAADPAKP